MSSDARSDSQLKTVTEQSKTPDAAPLFVLRVIKGKDNGKTLTLDWNKTPVVLVGQSRACELVLADPRVSRRHLSFAPDGARLRVQDTRSTNGTRIGGVRMVEALLEGGELVEIGDTTIRIVRAGEVPAAPEGRDRFGRVLGKSHDMQRVFAQAERLSAGALPLIIEGETGTGKELLAEAIHDASARATGPFVVFDCSSQTGEEELAKAIEGAKGGTLVLDNVFDLSQPAQGRVATAIEREDVRFIATTRRDLDRAVEDGLFREELLFRLSGARIQLPPLKRRHGDVDLLARHFWQLFGGTSEMPKAFAIGLARQEWPGNVRELQHAVARAVTLGDEARDTPRLESPAPKPAEPDFIDRILDQKMPMPRARQAIVLEFETRFVQRAIKEHGNISRAAAASGLTRRYFHMLLAKQR